MNTFVKINSINYPAEIYAYVRAGTGITGRARSSSWK